MRAARFKRLLATFRRSDEGLAALELALYAPVLAAMLLGGFELARFASLRGGVDKVAFSVADVTSQYKELTSDTMKQVFKITASSVPTFVTGVTGVTVLTSIYLDDKGVSKVKWQCYSSAKSGWTSKIGAEGATAAVDASLLADVKDNLMVSEVFYKFTPLFKSLFKSNFDIYSSSTYRPRLGTLTTKPC